MKIIIKYPSSSFIRKILMPLWIEINVTDMDWSLEGTVEIVL